MLKFYHLLFAALGTMIAFQCMSQEPCASDHLHNIFLSKQKNHTRHLTMEDIVLQRVQNKAALDGEICIIPVVVHVVEWNGNLNVNVDDAEQSIEWLNHAFANSGPFESEDGESIPIQFCLAKRDPQNNPSTGVNYVSSPLTDMISPIDDEALKALIVWDTERYLNVWVVNTILGAPNSPGVVGYATFPDSHGDDNDGIVLEADYFTGDTEDAGVLIHEAGHYLGLYHTFQAGCPNDNCLTSGDKVCDTPPDEHLFNEDCFDGTNSCDTDEDDVSENNPFRPIDLGGLGDQDDLQSNYMDYAGLACMELFTPGQGERMVATVLGVRSSLLNEINCFPFCEGTIAVNTTQSADEIEVGESVIFENLSTGQTSIEWSVDGTLLSENNTFNFTPSQQGTYNVVLTLYNDDLGCAEQTDFQLIVNCSIELVISSEATIVEPNATLSFESSSDDLASIAWYAGDDLVGTGASLEYTFSEIGLINVYAVGSNGVCEVFSNLIQVSVGSCTSGKQNNNWRLAHGDSYFTADFNGIEAVFDIDWSSNYTVRGQSTISNEQGELLYHCGEAVIKGSDLEILENGDSIKTRLDFFRSNIFLQNPYNSDEYYLFSIGDGEDDTYPLYYSVIDALANDEMGAVTSVKNEFLIDPQSASLNIINHCNTVDKWLVYFNLEVDAFMAHLIDENGINPEPVVSPIGDVIFGGGGFYHIYSSQKGDLALFRNYLISFDQETGAFEIVKSLGIYEEVNGNSLGIWAYEISPEAKYAYVYYQNLISTDPITHIERVVQIDLFATEVIDPNDYFLIYEDTTTTFTANPVRGMKLGPNGKIYYSHKSTPVVIEINNPDSPGELMQIDEISIPDNSPGNWDFGGSFAAYNTPPEMSIEGDGFVCVGAETWFSVDVCIDPIEWSVEGPAELIEFTDNAIQCNFVDTGSVMLIASAMTLCGELTDTLVIDVLQAPDLDLGPDMGYCLSDPTITLDMGDEFDSYLWSTGSTDQTLSLSSPEPQIIQATGYFGECFVTDEIEILGVLADEIDLGPDSDLCDGTAIILDAGEGYVDYEWQDGSNGQSYTAFLGGDYYVTATIPCFATDTIYIDECGQSIDDSVDVSTTEISQLSRISVFPNPTSNEATLRYYSPKTGKITLSIFNILGKCIRREEILVNVGINDISIHTESLAIARYFIMLQDRDSLLIEPFVIVR